MRVWEPVGPARAELVALHGFGDHKAAFDGLGGFLAGHGIRVVAYDQPGFGEQADRGFWAGSEVLAQELRRVLAARRAEQPELPRLVLGESMGAAVATLALAGLEPSPITGLVLVAPAVWGGDTLSPIYRKLIEGLARLVPWLRLSGRGLPVRAADDLELLRALARDPLYLGEPRAAAVAGLIELMDRARAAGPALGLPTLVLVPGRDEVVPPAVQLSFAATLAAEPCRLIFYPEARHLLLRDRDRHRPWQDILAWLEQRPPPSGLGKPCRASGDRSRSLL